MPTTSINIKFSVERARRAQALIAKKAVIKDRLPKEIEHVVGVDAAYFQDWVVGAASVLNYKTMEVLETQTTTMKAKLPYIPTLFAFREMPALVGAIRKLGLQADVVLVDGHGRAHPYRCGLACHLGVALNMPAIGVAKNRLVGDVKNTGQVSLLVDEGEVIGAMAVTKQGAKPVYVSVGHRVSLTTAIEIVKNCSRENRVPEPIRAAHHLASEELKAKIYSSEKIGAIEQIA